LTKANDTVSYEIATLGAKQRHTADANKGCSLFQTRRRQDTASDFNLQPKSKCSVLLLMWSDTSYF